ncbi:MAG: hypothetical protein F2842_11180 [Actinobacteria bacterium]|uniref:Unannotated protein n=1 Tax=freshwater metagenome TaxID=449393 RepID=A0A6J7LD36_9ZZZZ|nr:hypothetical protein [Actinomycetota bacterium]MSW42764.1 hypothetical protein [Actinomycetota bacterium]
MFRTRIGLVTTLVVAALLAGACGRPTSSAEARGYYVSSDGRTVTVLLWATGGFNVEAEVKVQNDRQVEIAARQTEVADSNLMNLECQRVSVSITDPLGSREVVINGRAIPPADDCIASTSP